MKGILLLKSSELRGLQSKIPLNYLGSFEEKAESDLLSQLLTCGYSLGFSPKTRVEDRVLKNGKKIGANFAIIDSTEYDSDQNYKVNGKYYRINLAPLGIEI